MTVRTRRRHGSEFFSQVQDPGKDLFAYLFLVMLIFAFTILLTYEQKVRRAGMQRSPREVAAGTSSVVTLDSGDIGTLTRHDGRVCLVFENRRYDPATDITRLEEQGVIKTIQQEGRQTKVLYIEEEARSRIYLKEYLQTFASLNSRGIDIAFARRIK